MSYLNFVTYKGYNRALSYQWLSLREYFLRYWITQWSCVLQFSCLRLSALHHTWSILHCR